MNAITVWLLITVSNGAYNYGTTTVVDRFPNQETCDEVRREIPSSTVGQYRSSPDVLAKCIRATIVRPV